MSTSYYCLPLNFNPCPFPSSKTLLFPILKPYRKYRHSLSTTSFVCSSSLSSNYEREEARWLREEQRWLREEQRWLREESTWHAQLDSLIAENFALKIQIQRGLVLEVAPEASIGAREDGIKTAEHQFEYSTIVPKEDPKLTAVPKEGANGVAVVSVTGISHIQPKIVKDKGDTETDVTQHRVFLLGENRWEEPSRLLDRNKFTTNCLSCRGEGRMICSECDGSGEPNIEPQFLEWGDEEMKCPYCKGIGFATCDVCDGKGEAVFR